MNRTILLFIVAASLSASMNAQASKDRPYGVSAGLALMPSSFFREYQFRYSVLSSALKTSFFGTVGVSYLAFQLEERTSILFSVEAIYGQSSTPVTYRLSYRGQMKDELLFVGLWTKLIVPATISPFVKLGAGVLKRHLREMFSTNLTNYDLRETRFAIAAGGGIDFALSNTITLSLFGDGVITASPPLVAFPALGARVCLAI